MNIESRFEYLKKQLELEGLEVINGNRLKVIPVNHFDIEKSANPKAPYIMIVNFVEITKVFYSIELSEKQVENIENMSVEELIFPTKRVLTILQSTNIFSKPDHYRTYIFENRVKTDSAKTRIFVNNSDELIKKFDLSFYKTYPTLYATMNHGEIVACCVSSRESEMAGEAWIFTSPEHRKKGFGIKAVQLWARELQNIGKIPFYSHELKNIASQKLAEKLGLKMVFESTLYE